MFRSIAIGAVLICVTIVIHAVGSMAWMHLIMKRYAGRDGDWKTRDTIPVLVSTGAVLLMLKVVEVTVWAATYRSKPGY